MKLFLVCLIVVVAVVSVSEAGPITRSMQRRIDRIEKLIESLNNRDRSLVGQARDENQARIQRLRDNLTTLRKGEDAKEEDVKGEDVKDEDAETDSEPKEKQDRRRRATEDDDKKDDPGFVTRRIDALRNQISAMEERASTLTGRARDLLFKQIDLQRALLDRLIRRPVNLII